MPVHRLLAIEKTHIDQIIAKILGYPVSFISYTSDSFWLAFGTLIGEYPGSARKGCIVPVLCG
jgi:hypothetical protein